MYMQALDWPDTAGEQMPLVQLKVRVEPEGQINQVYGVYNSPYHDYDSLPREIGSWHTNVVNY